MRPASARAKAAWAAALKRDRPATVRARAAWAAAKKERTK